MLVSERQREKGRERERERAGMRVDFSAAVVASVTVVTDNVMHPTNVARCFSHPHSCISLQDEPGRERKARGVRIR